jgi:hypothetical protein
MENLKLLPDFDAYFVRMDPQDDGGYAYIDKVGRRKGIKLLSPDEQVKLRELLLADGQLGKKVGRNGVDGEGYVVLNTFPRMNELDRFFFSLASEEIDNDTFYSMNVKKKAAFAAAEAAAKAEGGYRRRSSLRKSAKRKQNRKSRATKLRLATKRGGGQRPLGLMIKIAPKKDKYFLGTEIRVDDTITYYDGSEEKKGKITSIILNGSTTNDNPNLSSGFATIIVDNNEKHPIDGQEIKGPGIDEPFQGENGGIFCVGVFNEMTGAQTFLIGKQISMQKPIFWGNKCREMKLLTFHVDPESHQINGIDIEDTTKLTKDGIPKYFLGAELFNKIKGIPLLDV